MRVALGTIEIDDDARKAIRKLSGGKGDATRSEVKDYLLTQIDDQVIPNLLGKGTDGDAPAGDGTDAEEPRSFEEQREAPAHESPEPPHSDEQLPEVPGPGTTTGYTGGATAATGTAGTTTGGDTGPTSGNLGSDGTPGGTSA